ncbi:putative glutamine amidotransferase-like protein [Acanthamoeba castellanii mimivirus]|jgi:GMP synthase-like glutamine amidotransferase|uniref:Putative glutamine amidotransferase-like protein L716 n=5 Tax=Mimivirus TaxID=315393 RepID=YL716_MIMIV|nr:putative glutamine amidotransferase-like protein [Acanthamoeba polyphaga mimivirus]Q5UNX1.1 RecName: Full=Putative glutamine amidotransferase-like protein L716 [Acanthamoeba polyphaga mimivirus]AEQ60928.1 Glutamine amidotransferase [Acanthamoeba castellanii mamavirus]AHA45117.1 putative glutamine amidotransferase-like protein [Hirudovirus strain Sangsue]AHJ40335.1 glutamine amidotransferase [Samba virus]ALR84339.1 glutamine amidotransferase [Niemeyer virus]AMZ03161.1 putative glutamine ami
MLLIIQNGYITPYIYRYLDEDYEIIKSFNVDVTTMDLDKYSVVIILGGYQSVVDINKYSYLLKVIELIKKCLTVKKPLFGICLGFQLIAYALGCEIKSSGKLNVGYDTTILGYDNVFRCHIDYIIPNDSVEVLEYFDNMPYLYKHDNHVYGIQCHPDIAPECIKKYSNHIESYDYAAANKDSINKTNAIIIKYILNLLRDSIKKD